MSEQVIKCITCGHSERRFSDGYCAMCERIADMASDYATLQAECANLRIQLKDADSAMVHFLEQRNALRQQVEALQSEENSYQSGFDAGRATSAKFADDWRKECERLRSTLNNLRSGIAKAADLSPARYADSYLIAQVSELQRCCEELEAIKTQEHVAEVSTLNGQPIGVPMLKNGKWTLVPGQKLYAMPAVNPRHTPKK